MRRHILFHFCLSFLLFSCGEKTKKDTDIKKYIKGSSFTGYSPTSHKSQPSLNNAGTRLSFIAASPSQGKNIPTLHRGEGAFGAAIETKAIRVGVLEITSHVTAKIAPSGEKILVVTDDNKETRSLYHLPFSITLPAENNAAQVIEDSKNIVQIGAYPNSQIKALIYSADSSLFSFTVEHNGTTQIYVSNGTKTLKVFGESGFHGEALFFIEHDLVFVQKNTLKKANFDLDTEVVTLIDWTDYNGLKQPRLFAVTDTDMFLSFPEVSAKKTLLGNAPSLQGESPLKMPSKNKLLSKNLSNLTDSWKPLSPDTVGHELLSLTVNQAGSFIQYSARTAFVCSKNGKEEAPVFADVLTHQNSTATLLFGASEPGKDAELINDACAALTGDNAPLLLPIHAIHTHAEATADRFRTALVLGNNPTQLVILEKTPNTTRLINLK